MSNYNYNELYYNIKNIPKGSIHHAHFSGYVRYNIILDLLQKKYNNNIIFSYSKNLLSFGKNNKKIDFDYIKKLIKKNKNNFGLLGGMFYNIIKNVLFIDDYFNLIMREMDEDNIMHIDLRIRFGSYFKHNERNKLSIIEEIKLFKKQQERFKRNGKSFGIIVTASKREPFIKIRKNFKFLDSLKDIDDLIYGYDIVGDESSGYKLSDYGDELIQFDKPFYFHAGETSERIDNILFSIKNGSRRIAHGIYVINNERLLNEIIKKEIVLEVCPISNIELGLVKDPLIYKKLLDKGVLISISPDDPNKLGDTNLTDNFIYLLEKGNFTYQDIYKCILTSIKYSLVNEERKLEMIDNFDKKINFSKNFSLKNYLYDYNFLRKELYRYDIFLKIKDKKDNLDELTIENHIKNDNISDPLLSNSFIKKEYSTLYNKIKNLDFNKYLEKKYKKISIINKINYQNVVLKQCSIYFINKTITTCISKNILNKTRKIYLELNGKDKIDDFKRGLIILLFRYKLINKYNIRSNISSNLLNQIIEYYNPTELFTSALYHNTKKYIGLFYDVEFSYGCTHFKNKGNYLVNIPYSKNIAINIFDNILKKLEGNKDNLLFIIILPELNINIKDKFKRYECDMLLNFNTDIINKILLSKKKKNIKSKIFLISNKKIKKIKLKKDDNVTNLKHTSKNEIKKYNDITKLYYKNNNKKSNINFKYKFKNYSKPIYNDLENIVIKTVCQYSKTTKFIGIYEDTKSLIFYGTNELKNYFRNLSIIVDDKFFYSGSLNEPLEKIETKYYKDLDIYYKNDIPYYLNYEIIPITNFSLMQFLLFRSFYYLTDNLCYKQNILVLDFTTFNNFQTHPFSTLVKNHFVDAFVSYNLHKNPDSIIFNNNKYVSSADFDPTVKNVDNFLLNNKEEYDLIIIKGGTEFNFRNSILYFSENIRAYLILLKIYYSLNRQKINGDLHIWSIGIYHRITHDMIYLLSNLYEKVSFVNNQPYTIDSTIIFSGFKGVSKEILLNIKKLLKKMNSINKKYGEYINVTNKDIRKKYCIKKPILNDLKDKNELMLVSLFDYNDIPLEFKKFIKECLYKKYNILDKYNKKLSKYKNIINNGTKEEIKEYIRKNNFDILINSIKFAKDKNIHINKYYRKFISNNFDKIYQ
ncbi:MAG: hypothetical protein CMF96_10605 [Candidatus Marinimicrobia bacterium]|nr:hypothetical protein [Candidatus Neomarinimicrobiota bacterium]